MTSASTCHSTKSVSKADALYLDTVSYSFKYCNANLVKNLLYSSDAIIFFVLWAPFNIMGVIFHFLQNHLTEYNSQILSKIQIKLMMKILKMF